MVLSGVFRKLAETTQIVKNNKNDTFQNSNGVNQNQNQNPEPTYTQLVVLLVMVILWLTLVLLVGKYLWNECLCKVVTVCKPIDSVYTLLGLIILFDMLHPNM